MAFPGEHRRRGAELVVCETGNEWAVAFRRLLAGEARVFETRSLDECRGRLAHRAHRVAAVQWSVKFRDELPEWIWLAKRWCPKCRILVLGAPVDAPGHWAAREAGADCVATTTRDLAMNKPWILRYLAKAPPKTFETKRNEVAASLPWADFESSGKFRATGE